MNQPEKAYKIFINRKPEMGLVWERLSPLRSGYPVTEPILFFYGIPGIGKSTLLENVRQQASGNLIPTASIDLGIGFEGELGARRIGQEIMAQWQASADVGPSTFLASTDDPTEIAKKLTAYAHQLATGARPAPTALLFDNVEAVEPTLFTWLQGEVLTPILNDNKTFVAITSSARDVPLQWPISRRTRTVPIKPFTREESRLHINKLVPDQQLPISDPLLSVGIPGLNEILAGSNFQTEASAVGQLVTAFFGQIPECSLYNQGILLAMSKVEQFDLLTLAQTANHLWPHEFPTADRRTGAILSHQLMGMGLIEDSPDGHGKRVTQSLSPLLRLHKSLMNN